MRNNEPQVHAAPVALPTWAVWTVTAVAAALVTALFVGYGGARVQVDGRTLLLAISQAGETAGLAVDASHSCDASV